MKKQLFKRGLKTFEISFGATLLSIGVLVLVTFAMCFFLKANVSVPFNILDITSKQDSDGFYTQIFFGSELLWTSLSIFFVVWAALFTIFSAKQKKISQKQA
ncbi:MAG: hypothetical protein LBL93_06535 [Ruminococcus sp.]|jgi:hypothetical protein|nr:hypothetical protein [Ruminococcus sp.]